MLSRRCLLALIVLVLGATGCSPAARLVGQWEVDTDQVTGDSGNALGALASNMMSMFQVGADFNADGTCSVSTSFLGQSLDKPGKWRFVKTEGSVLVLMVQMDGDNAERELRVGFTDNDHLEMVPPGVTENKLTERKLTFKRIKPA